MPEEELTFSDQHYFNSYDHFGIHEEMLKDEVRTLSYRNALYHNRALFQDKVVLDVGCGSGILSMFAARAGAKHVIGVDRSSIIDMAREVVAVNGLNDRITLIQGKMEEVELPVSEVDVIVSEWMGYFLLYESMLDTVLFARDKYLKKGGLILPDKATIYIGGIEDEEYKDEKIGFWRNVYGFDYSPFEELAVTEPLVDIVELKALVTDPAKIVEFDLNTVTKQDLNFDRKFSLLCRRDDLVHGFVVWFDMEFGHLNNIVRFSTGPHAKSTHWKQTVFYTKEDFHVRSGDQIGGRMAVQPNALNPRDIDVYLEYQHVNGAHNGRKTPLKFVMR